MAPFIVAILLIAQTIVVSVPAYTTADPVNPDRLGLATDRGRYMIQPGAGCSGVVAGMDVQLVIDAIQGVLLIPASGQQCSVTIDAQMSATPCFTNARGACDVSAELSNSGGN